MVRRLLRRVLGPPRRRTLAQRLTDAVLAPVVICGGIALGLAIGPAGGVGIEREMVERPQPPAFDEAAALVAAHRCWTSAETMPPAMEGVIPGHVVVTWPGETRPDYEGAAAVSIALDHLFGPSWAHVDGLVVHGFCR